ncbi:unnamed protein product, partial [Timema podura]|nr:unnamed protein product [Timema podura]
MRGRGFRNTDLSDRVGKDVNQSWNTEVSWRPERSPGLVTGVRANAHSDFPPIFHLLILLPQLNTPMKETSPCACGTLFAVCVSVVCSCVPPHQVRGMTGQCAVCQAPATQCCSSCRAVFYCSRDHQKQHWRHHKTRCAPYRVEVDERLGRFLVASRDIKQGELILREPPLVLGPKTATFPLCLGCHRRLPSNLEGYHVCSGCNWPLCGPQCEGLAPHQDECQLMRESGHRADIPFESPQKKEAVYCNITPLRCLLLREKHPDKFSTLLNLQSHLEELRDTSLYNLFKTTMIGFLLDGLQLTDVDPEMVLRMCAILDTNAFDVRRKKGEVNVRGVYPTASFLSHDCTPNTKYTFVGPEFSLVLTATVPIRKGDVI